MNTVRARILVVDDEPAILDILRDLLTCPFYLSVRSAHAALRRYS
jgi:CheY-like chemotaxis protein